MTVLALAAVTSAGALTVAAPASAIVYSGYAVLNVGSSARQAVVTWDATYESNAVTAKANQSLTSGYRVDSWFDWATPEGKSHFDGRGARTCRAYTEMQGSQVFEAQNMQGMQKAGGAYGQDNRTTSGTVVNASGSTLSINTINVTMTTTNCSVRWWKRSAGNAVSYGSGGSPTSPTC